MILVFLEILSLGIWVIGVLYYNIILESLSTIFISFLRKRLKDELSLRCLL